MKCFIDANVLFSGANTDSQMHRLLLQMSIPNELITSNYAREEAIRNIRSKREMWEYGFSIVMQNLKVVPSVDQNIPFEIAAKDRPILATAIAHQCDRLITGDKKDFGHLFEKEFHGVTILTPLQWIQELNP